MFLQQGDRILNFVSAPSTPTRPAYVNTLRQRAPKAAVGVNMGTMKTLAGRGQQL